MVNETAAFTIPCCAHGYHVYQRMWTPLVGEITTAVSNPDSASDRYTEYRGDVNIHAPIWYCSCTTWNTMCNVSNSASFSNFASKCMQTLFLI